MIDEKKLSRRYAVRRLTAEDAEAVYALCRENSTFYRYHPPMVTVESVLEDMNALPPNKTFADKYFVGFWNGEALIAVLDLRQYRTIRRHVTRCLFRHMNPAKILK